MKEHRAPRGYFFVAPWGAGTTLQGYFSDKTKLKEELFKAWDKNCRKKITETQEISLDGEFLAYANAPCRWSAARRDLTCRESLHRPSSKRLCRS